jgi:predicted DNA-binding transcriptional regulator AlpA
MTTDMLQRLESDPGSRTIGELLQERAWAVTEILQLRSELQKLRQRTQSRVVPKAHFSNTRDVRWHPSDPNRLLTVNEVCDIVGFSRAMIYRMIHEQIFPAQVRAGPRCARWRMSDVISWQANLAPSNTNRSVSEK